MKGAYLLDNIRQHMQEFMKEHKIPRHSWRSAPTIRNAMTDCICATLSQFEQRMVDGKDSHGL